MLLVSCRVVTGVKLLGEEHVLISYSVAICSMWSLSSLYCSGKENRIIPEMVCRNGLAQSAHRSATRLLAVHQYPVCLQEHTRGSGHLFSGTWVLQEWCHVWSVAPSSHKKVQSSASCLERDETLRLPEGCKRPGCSHSFS